MSYLRLFGALHLSGSSGFMLFGANFLSRCSEFRLFGAFYYLGALKFG